MNDLSLPMLLLEDSSAPLNVIGLQPCWSRLNRLATDFMKGTKAISALHPHTPTLTLHLVLGWRQGSRGSGTVGQTEGRRRGVFRGLVADILSCPELLRQSVSPIVQQHPPFFIHHPLCPPPFYALIGQIVSGGPDVYIHLQALIMSQIIL